MVLFIAARVSQNDFPVQSLGVQVKNPVTLGVQVKNPVTFELRLFFHEEISGLINPFWFKAKRNPPKLRKADQQPYNHGFMMGNCPLWAPPELRKGQNLRLQVGSPAKGGGMVAVWKKILCTWVFKHLSFLFKCVYLYVCMYIYIFNLFIHTYMVSMMVIP